ncbi:MAG: hypothetical protein J6B01_04910 [Ruminococcus sp.]|nr:hypothetical protein [Ruminococcus sp.]MBO5319132.1 hypothetical protein [Ruminococcus sp.]
MFIIIHRQHGRVAAADSVYLYNQLKVNFPDEVIEWDQIRRKFNIRDITILFYFGDVYKMSGIKTDYYNCDSHLACDYCKTRVRSNIEYDPELQTFSDVLGIIRKEIEKND